MTLAIWNGRFSFVKHTGFSPEEECVQMVRDDRNLRDRAVGELAINDCRCARLENVTHEPYSLHRCRKSLPL